MAYQTVEKKEHSPRGGNISTTNSSIHIHIYIYVAYGKLPFSIPASAMIMGKSLFILQII